MFGSLGGPEIVLIFMVALIVFGPRRLPEIGRKVGGLLRELRRATGEFRTSVEREIGFDPLEGMEKVRKARRDVLSTVSEPIREVARESIDAARSLGEPVREVARESIDAARSLGEPVQEAPRKSIDAARSDSSPDPPEQRPREGDHAG